MAQPSLLAYMGGARGDGAGDRDRAGADVTGGDGRGGRRGGRGAGRGRHGGGGGGGGPDVGAGGVGVADWAKKAGPSARFVEKKVAEVDTVIYARRGRSGAGGSLLERIGPWPHTSRLLRPPDPVIGINHFEAYVPASAFCVRPLMIWAPTYMYQGMIYQW